MVSCVEDITFYCRGMFPKPSPVCGIYNDHTGMHTFCPFLSSLKILINKKNLKISRCYTVVQLYLNIFCLFFKKLFIYHSFLKNFYEVRYLFSFLKRMPRKNDKLVSSMLCNVRLCTLRETRLESRVYQIMILLYS